jgi:hypothetical protein
MYNISVIIVEESCLNLSITIFTLIYRSLVTIIIRIKRA